MSKFPQDDARIVLHADIDQHRPAIDVVGQAKRKEDGEELCASRATSRIVGKTKGI